MDTKSSRPRRWWRRITPPLAALSLAAGLAGGDGLTGRAGAAAPSGTRVLTVVAAENFWGSLASQLGGRQVRVTSIVSDPNADPHEYESNPIDARALAGADFVILNGAGYDSWADRLLSAQPEPHRLVLTVAALLDRHDGDNPHFWYDPAYVSQVVRQITADYEHLEPRESAYFAGRAAAVHQAFAPYRQRLAYIQSHFAGTAVAATESIFAYLADYLHLDLVTPYPFMKAVAEGDDVPADAEATFVRQIRAKAFKVLVYNIQTVTPLTTSIKEETAAQNIPTVAVSETIEPPMDSFEEWMDGQLERLANALDAGALGR